MRVAAWSRLNHHNKEMRMPQKIGYNAIRDPYPWDGAEVLANAAAWTCCGMNLPATYSLCRCVKKDAIRMRLTRPSPRIDLTTNGARPGQCNRAVTLHAPIIGYI